MRTSTRTRSGVQHFRTSITATAFIIELLTSPRRSLSHFILFLWGLMLFALSPLPSPSQPPPLPLPVTSTSTSTSYFILGALASPITEELQPHSLGGDKLSLPAPGLGLKPGQPVAYYDPVTRGGSMLDLSNNGLGEPLNVIISGLSSPSVLTNDGFLNYARSLGFSIECLGLHRGFPHSANLGDGRGQVNQSLELRADFGEYHFGTCLESVIGGNHLRMYRQDGPEANSGALFLSVSVEKSIFYEHDIVDDGYNAGRDEFVARAVGATTSFHGIKYSTSSKEIIYLLPKGDLEINHGIAQDGVVKLLTVETVQ